MNPKSLLLVVSLLISCWTTHAEEPDWSSYKKVLSHVKTGTKNGVVLTLVDYSAIKAEGSLAKAYQELSTFKLENLSSREEKLAFYINAYNILALKMVADHWPLKSIKDVGNDIYSVMSGNGKKTLFYLSKSSFVIK